MNEFLGKVLEIIIVIFLTSNKSLGDLNSSTIIKRSKNNSEKFDEVYMSIYQNSTVCQHYLCQLLRNQEIVNNNIKINANVAQRNESLKDKNTSRTYAISPPTPSIDPISILAILAFLAFLIQSFASLFDRSRSLLPTIISGRQFSPELHFDRITDITAQVLHALEEFNSFKNEVNLH